MEPSLNFHGGRFGAAVPLLFFVAWAIGISVAGAPDERGLILGLLIVAGSHMMRVGGVPDACRLATTAVL